MHEQTILIPAVPPTGHRVRLLMQTALFLLVPVIILATALTVIAALLI